MQVVEGSADALPAADPSAEFAVWLALPSSLASDTSGGARPSDPPASSLPGVLWPPQEDPGGLQRFSGAPGAHPLPHRDPRGQRVLRRTL